MGTLTSILDTAEGPLGLGYIRTKAGGAGLQVTVGEAEGTVVDVPFLSRGYLAEQKSWKSRWARATFDDLQGLIVSLPGSLPGGDGLRFNECLPANSAFRILIWW